MAEDVVEVMAQAMWARNEALAPPPRGSFRCGVSWQNVNDKDRVFMLEIARAALAALEGAGYAVVPVVPTEAMKQNGSDEIWPHPDGRYNVEREEEVVGNIYTAMLAAYKQSTPSGTPGYAVVKPEAFWAALTDSQRYDLTHDCCHGCGSLNTRCRCWDDS